MFYCHVPQNNKLLNFAMEKGYQTMYSLLLLNSISLQVFTNLYSPEIFDGMIGNILRFITKS